MDLNQCQEFFNKLYAGKKVEYGFDEKCHHVIAFILTDGMPNSAHHLECNKVKVTVEGMDPMYVPIVGHKSVAGLDYLRKTIAEKTDFYMHPQEKDLLVKAKAENTEAYDLKVTQLADSLGMSRELVEGKLA